MRRFKYTHEAFGVASEVHLLLKHCTGLKHPQDPKKRAVSTFTSKT